MVYYATDPDHAIFENCSKNIKNNSWINQLFNLQLLSIIARQ